MADTEKRIVSHAHADIVPGTVYLTPEGAYSWISVNILQITMSPNSVKRSIQFHLLIPTTLFVFPNGERRRF